MVTSYMRATEFRVEQARRVLPLARDNNDPTLVLACQTIMVAWLEGRHVERNFIALVDEFDPLG